jgi:hypothetical protein
MNNNTKKENCMTLPNALYTPDPFPFKPPSIDPPAFIILAGASVAVTLVGVTALVMKYGVGRVIRAIPAYSFEIGLLLGTLVMFNLTFTISSVWSPNHRGPDTP